MKKAPTSVELSGVVYVKDPRDIEKISVLRNQVGVLKAQMKNMYDESDFAKALKERNKMLDRKAHLLSEAQEWLEGAIRAAKAIAYNLTEFKSEYANLRKATFVQVMEDSFDMQSYYEEIEQQLSRLISASKSITSRLEKLSVE